MNETRRRRTLHASDNPLWVGSGPSFHSVNFPARRPTTLGQTAEIGQKRTYKVWLYWPSAYQRESNTMKKILKTLSWLASILLSAMTVLAAVIYLFGIVIWMHAPVVPALLLTLAMALPFLALAWILCRLGRLSSQHSRTRPWYSLQDKR